MIRVTIYAHTDGGDFKMNVPLPGSCENFKIKYELDYDMRFDFYTSKPQEEIVKFLSTIEVITIKEKRDITDTFNANMKKYIDEINRIGLHTCNDDLLCGNHSMNIEMFKIESEWLSKD